MYCSFQWMKSKCCKCSKVFSGPGLLYKHLCHSFIHSLTDWLTHPLVQITLWRCHAQTVKIGASSHKTNYIGIVSEILNLKGHLNCSIGSKVTTILLNGWILPTGGVASGRVCSAACAASLFNKLVWLHYVNER